VAGGVGQGVAEYVEARKQDFPGNGNGNEMK